MSGERIDPRKHEVVVTHTFRLKWDEWYKKMGQRQKPGEGEMFEVMKRCVQYLGEELPFPVEHGRFAFGHADFPNQVFIAVLEGVTAFQPVGMLSFIGWQQYHTRAVVRGRIDLSAPPTYAPAPDDWADHARENYLTRRLRECDQWLDKCPDAHAYRRPVRETRDRFAADLAATIAAPRRDDDLADRVAELERRQGLLEQALRQILGE